MYGLSTLDAEGEIGSLQALEAIKHLAGIGTPIKGRLLVWDGRRTEFRTFRVPKDPHCPLRHPVVRAKRFCEPLRMSGND